MATVFCALFPRILQPKDPQYAQYV